MTSEFENFLDALGRVEKLTPRDILIMGHAYELGFRNGVETAKDIMEKETK